MKRRKASPEKLREIAMDASVVDCEDVRFIYDAAMMHKYGDKPPLLQDENKIKRYMVNTIRHTMSNYDKGVKQANYTHTYHGYYIYKNVVLGKIANQYPFLADECIRQMYRVPMVRKHH